MAQKTATSDVWTAEERAAMREAAAEAKRAAKRGADNAAGEADILAKIAEMPEPDRSQAASKFNVRYATFGFQPDARLDDGAMWANAFAVVELTPEVEERIALLVKRAAS
jgi:hypothetical protein